MFDKMSQRSYQNTISTLPEEQYDPITNWMSDLPPLSKKPRVIHPRQRGLSKHQQQHQQHRQQHQPHQHQGTSIGQKSNSHQAHPQPFHSSIVDGLSQGKRFSVERSKAGTPTDERDASIRQ